jgi:LPXTG-motif cell wall-anchored protein
VPTTTFTSTTVPSSTPQIEVLVQPKDPQAATTAPPGIAKLSLVVSSGTTQQTLELRINLSKFSLVGGNIPLPQLPKTGSSSDNVVRIGIVLMAFGVLMITTRRRLRKTF